MYNFFPDIPDAPYTSTNCWWISTDAMHFTHKNWITLHTLTSDHVAVCKLTVWWYDTTTPLVLITWWNLWSDVAMSCDTCCYIITWNYLILCSF
jgi:hypothetical protein